MKTIDKKIEEINSLINGVIEEQGVGITVSIVKKDELIFAKGYGYAQLEPTTSLIDENTIMSIQSVTKNFVAVCIMKLVEKGSIQLDTPIIKYLPYFRTKDKNLSDQITVKHVLSHTTGFPADLGIANLVAPNVKEIYSDTPTEWGEALAYYRLVEDELTSIHTREDITRWFRKVKLESPPGHDWNYCTDAYVILGDLIEKVTGESWETFLQNQFLTPLQMTRTTTDTNIILTDNNYAKYYLGTDKVETPYPTNSLAAPIGFLYSTATDLAKYMSFHLNYSSSEQLENTLKKQMQNPVCRVSEEWDNETNTCFYGLGWFIEDYKGKTIIEHGGGQMAVRALISLIPEENIGVAVLLNFDSTVHRYISSKIIDILLDL